MKKMESNFFNDTLFNVVQDPIDHHYRFKYDQCLSGGSLVIYIMEKYGLAKLKEILNYHKIKNKQNILEQDIFPRDPQLEHRILSLLTPSKRYSLDFATKQFIDRLIEYHSPNPVLEYFILNRNLDELNFILNEMKFDPNKFQWDYSNCTISFNNRDHPDTESIAVSTVIKIIVDDKFEECKEDQLNNMMRILTSYFNKEGNFDREDFIRCLIPMLYRKNLDIFLERFLSFINEKFFLSSSFSHISKSSLKFELLYGHDLKVESPTKLVKAID